MRRRGRQAFLQHLIRVCEEILLRDLIRIDVGQQRTLCLVFAVLDPCLALQQPPRLPALDS
jgi:hypothetical protein